PVRIELPSGTYVPEFRVAAVESPPTPSRARRPRRVALAAAIVAAACAVAWLATRTTPTPLDEFWGPVFRGSSPVLVCAAYVPVFGLDRDANATQPVRPEDFVALTDQFVGGGDLV